MRKLLLSSFFFFTLAAHANQETLQGSHQNLDYLFVLNDQWNDVQGSWGHSRYNLSWDEVTGEISGQTAGEKQEFEIDASNSRILGITGCGYFDLTIAETSSVQVKGPFCGQEVNETFSDKAALKTWIEQKILRQMLVDFPEPTQAVVLKFFSKRLRF